MKAFTAIAAMSLNRVIGNGNRIPWHLPEDFKWFKRMTTGHVVVMGRKTFESIGRPLPNRETIVLSRSDFQHPGVRVVRDLNELMESPKPTPASAGGPSPQPSPHPMGRGSEPGPISAPREIFICGGAQVYAQALPLCSDLFLTLVKRTVNGDAFFPKFEDQFELAEEIRDGPEFKILHYRRGSGRQRGAM